MNLSSFGDGSDDDVVDNDNDNDNDDDDDKGRLVRQKGEQLKMALKRRQKESKQLS